MTGRLGWFRDLCIVAALTQAVFGAVRVLISYRALEMGSGGLAIGLLTAAYSLVPLAIALPTGRLSDGRHLSTVLRAGSGISLVAVVVIAAAGSLGVLLSGTILLGIGNLMTMVASQAYVPRRSEPVDFDRRFGGFSLWVSVGQACGLPIAGVVASTFLRTQGALVAMGALVGIALIVTLMPSLNTGQLLQPPRSASEGGVLAMISDPGMRAAIFSSLVVLTAIDLMAAYLPMLGAQRDWSVFTVTLIITARSVSSIFSRALLPPLLNYLPRRALLISGTAGSVLPIAVLPAMPSATGAVAMMAVAGAFWGIAQPLTMSWVSGLVDPARRGLALSLRVTGNRLGQTATPVMAGMLSAVAGTGSVYFATAALLAAAAALTARSTRNVE